MKLLILFFISTCLTAQQINIDTLLKNTRNLPDTSKVKYLNDFAWNNRNKSPNLALESAKEALKLAESIKNKILQAKALNYIGVIYRNLGNYDFALKMYNKALIIAEESRDSSQLAYSYNNIGGIYRLEGNNKIALEYIIKALRIFERKTDKQGISYCTINIGIIYRRQQDYTKALEYLNYTIKIRNEINDKPGKALALNQIAEVYYDMGVIDTALKYYYEVEKQYSEIDDKKGLAATWGGIGGIYLYKKDYNQALTYRLKALNLSIEIDYLEGQVTNYNNLGKIYFHLGQSAKAEESYQKALKIALGMKEIYGQLECYRFLSDYYELRNDLKRALQYNKKYYALRDSVSRKENIAMIYQYEANQKDLRNETEKALLQKENEIQKKQAQYLFAIIILIAVFSFTIYKKARRTKILNEELNESNLIKDRFFHIIAHDLKNPFTSLLGFSEILEEDFDELSDEDKLRLIKEIRVVIRSNYKLLENLLYWANMQRKNVTLNSVNINLMVIIREIESLFLISLRNKKLKVVLDVEDSIAVYADKEMLSTTLRNLLSNAIKFSNKEGEIKISALADKNLITVIVEDEGAGIAPDKISKLFQLDKIMTSEGTDGEKGTGLGLILCKEFVEKNGGKIWAENKEGTGIKFCFTLPLAKVNNIA